MSENADTERCPIHESYKPCEHNGGVLTLERGYVWPDQVAGLTLCTYEEWCAQYDG